MDVVCTFVVLLLQGVRTSWTYTNPFYAWPLAPDHSTAEIIGHPSVGTADCISSATGHPALDYNGLELRGSANSYAEFTLDTTVHIEDFSIMIFVLPEANSGTILHYEKQDQIHGINLIKNIILTYDNMTIYLNATGDHPSDILLSTSLVTNFQPDTWMPITITYDYSGENIAMYAGNAAKRAEIEEDIILGLPGKIRIGGVSQYGYDNYRGRATCVQFYNVKTSAGDFDDALLRCLSTSWPPDMGPSTGLPYPSCDAMRGYYQLIAKERRPPSSTVPIASLGTTSKIKCADWCLLPSNACISFVIDKANNVCNLYDVDDTAHLILGSGTDYYVSSALVNCC